MASASQEALLRYCNALLAPPAAAAPAPGAALQRWGSSVGSSHASDVKSALDTLVGSRLDALSRFAQTVAVRSGGQLVVSEIALAFDKADSSDGSALDFSNLDKTVNSRSGSNTMAVCNQGFASGKSSWEFKLDKVRL